MNRFASGPKVHYYGKGDVSVFRLNRTAKTPEDTNPVQTAVSQLRADADRYSIAHGPQ